MSRVGKKAIPVPKGVEVIVEQENMVTVKGPKGQLTRKIPAPLKIKVDAEQILVSRSSDKKQHRSLHGLGRTLLFNMVAGVTEGFSKNLELVGVGYRASKQGSALILNVGYSQPINVIPKKGIEIEVPSASKIIIKGIDKEVVGDTAARIRRIRPPEPYKGKGIRYEGEYIRRKVGKAGK